MMLTVNLPPEHADRLLSFQREWASKGDVGQMSYARELMGGVLRVVHDVITKPGSTDVILNLQEAWEDWFERVHLTVNVIGWLISIYPPDVYNETNVEARKEHTKNKDWWLSISKSLVALSSVISARLVTLYMDNARAAESGGTVTAIEDRLNTGFAKTRAVAPQGKSRVLHDAAATAGSSQAHTTMFALPEQERRPSARKTQGEQPRLKHEGQGVKPGGSPWYYGDVKTMKVLTDEYGHAWVAIAKMMTELSRAQHGASRTDGGAVGSATELRVSKRSFTAASVRNEYNREKNKPRLGL